MIAANNPVGRLYDILTALPNSGELVGEALVRQFGHPEEEEDIDAARILSLYADIARLTNEGIRVVRRLPGFDDAHKDTFLAPLLTITEVLSQEGPRTNCASFKNRLGSHTLPVLKTVSVTVGHLNPEAVASQEDFDELVGTLMDLEQDLVQSNLPADLKDALLKNLDKIRVAIRDYQIYGTAGLQTAIESAIGSAYVAVKQVSDDEKTEEYNSIIEKIGKAFDLGLKTCGIGFAANKVIVPLLELGGRLSTGELQLPQ